MPTHANRPRKFRRLGPDERRRSLIEATLVCLSRFGPHGTGVREICSEADVSPGLLRHYFDGKDELIVEAFRTVTREFHESVRDILADPATSAEHRLKDFIEIYFSAQVTNEERVGTYLAFWTIARTNPAMRRIRRSAYRKQRALLEPVLKTLADDRGARIDEQRDAISLIALLDGLWLEMGLDPTAFSRAMAGSMSWAWLEAYLLGRRP